MTKDNMLAILNGISFRQIWPESSWDDIGFTEGKIWVNSNGFGYYTEDEPTRVFHINLSGFGKWPEVMKQIRTGNLDSEIFTGSPIEALWLELGDVEFISAFLDFLVRSFENKTDFYCAETFDGPVFFNALEELIRWEDDREVDTRWLELDENVLKQWVERLQETNLEDWIEEIE